MTDSKMIGSGPDVSIPTSKRGLARARKARANPVIVDINPAPHHVERAFRHDATVTLDGTPKRAGVPRPHEHGRDPARQGIDSQIQQLRASLNKNLRQIADAVTANRLDQAGIILSVAATKRNRIVFLTGELARATIAPALPEPDPVQRTPKTRLAPRARKTYARWSDK